MPEIPHDGLPDSSLALLADPYGFIGKRCQRLGSELFRARLLLEPNICMMGRDAAEMFYDDERFVRKCAVLKRFERTLTGSGGVQGLDGDAHRLRKKLFTSLVTSDEAIRLGQMTAEEWRSASLRWEPLDSVVLYQEARDVICRAVCRWADIPVPEVEIGQLARELAAMYEYAASLGPGYFRARAARYKRDRWAADIVQKVRMGQVQPRTGSVLERIASHRNLDGQRLDPVTAGVELLNVLRPIVAVSVFITFAALALHEHPSCREYILSGNNDDAEMFAQEVRRFYPFFPAVAARVRQDFQWRGYSFPRGMRVILGLYATNHDPHYWDSPHEFRPERFRNWSEDPFAFIPQGGGDPDAHHRCPGDRASVELIKAAARFLCREIQYDVPPQDLRLPKAKLPPLPRSRFVMRNVRRVA